MTVSGVVMAAGMRVVIFIFGAFIWFWTSFGVMEIVSADAIPRTRARSYSELRYALEDATAARARLLPPLWSDRYRVSILNLRRSAVGRELPANRAAARRKPWPKHRL